MTMDSTFATLACYLLALSFAVAQTQTENLTITPTITTPGLNLTHITLSSSNSTVHGAVISNLTENTTPFTSTTRNNETSTETTAATTESMTTFTGTSHDNETSTKTTAATTESTSLLQTSQSTSVTTPLTNSTSLTMTTTPGTPTLTTPTTQTTAGNISTPDTTVITTANSSHTVNGTTASMERTTQGLGLNSSERNMTIVFSVVLGLFALALVAFTFHRCKHKIQYLHQPLHNTGDMAGEFEADDDTLVISGGLYDGHPIYDNVPTAPADQSQFRLQFLH